MNQMAEGEKTQSDGNVYAHIAHALARGYTDLYYVNMDTDEYIEFHTDDERGVLNEARRGSDFFEECEKEVQVFVHKDDQAAFLKTMNRRFLAEALDGRLVHELVYRRIKDGKTFYVLMRISRMEDNGSFVVIAVKDIDELMRQRRMEERIREERIVYARLQAITGNFICVYVVDPETEHYREFSSTEAFEEGLKQAKEGDNFFAKVRENAAIYNHPESLDQFLAVFTKENVLAEIERNGHFSLSYRFLLKDRPIYVQLKAALVEEKEGPRLIVGLNDVDAQVRQEKEMGKQLEQAQARAMIDSLTGIKNKYAFNSSAERMNRQIETQSQESFAIVVLDVNNLKIINDTLGHQAGDQYLKEACKIICDTFKHSPVFRLGGDEFAVIARGNDYEHMEELLEVVSRRNAEAAHTNGVVIACGMAKFDGDANVDEVFARADKKMYENKSKLKSGTKNNAAL
ncbi:MAG: GGDEF domain-containing protein [Acidaminococcaceae bacterium]|nr:GGDEF domain-containing protein [Acidaminococcaceae bacterium]